MAQAYQEPTSEVELSISCHGLPNMDTFSLSDPMVVVYAKDGNSWHEVGKTETIWDNLNPQFATSFDVMYYFERAQFYKFEVCHTSMYNDRYIIDKLI